MDEWNRPKTRIEWMLGNKCNYDCSYCLDLFKKGDHPFVTEEVLINISKDIIYHYDDLGHDVVFSFIGGEPTLLEKIPSLKKQLHNFPTHIVLKTNGSASLDWWEKSRYHFSEVVISVHREFADLEHIKKVVYLLQDIKTIHPIKLSVLFPVTIRPDSWEWGVNCVKKFRKKFEVGDLQLLYSNFGRGSNMFLPYKDYQWKEYNELLRVEEEEEIKLLNTSFKGSTCYAGIDTLVIDTFGNVFRGWCMQGGLIGNIYKGDIIWPKTPVVCGKDICKNGFDQKARKV